MNYLEVISVILSLIFLYLLIKQSIWCWPFGIISSAMSVYLFIDYKLYSEATLYACYVIFGIYGWYVWNENQEDKSTIKPVKSLHIIVSIALGIPLAIVVGFLAKKFTDAAIPYIDACTSVFGLIATYLEAHKYMTTWIFWIILNCVTTIVYYSRGLPVYAALMVVYFLVSIYGYLSWNRLLRDRLAR